MEKCKGAMLATAIGDALGWPNEPRAKNRAKKTRAMDNFVGWIRSSNNPRWHDEKILPGEYSDDTQLTTGCGTNVLLLGIGRHFLQKRTSFLVKLRAWRRQRFAKSC